MLHTILDIWKIRDESERWSLISMFLRHHGEDFSTADFIAFLESIYRGRRKYPDRLPPAPLPHKP